MGKRDRTNFLVYNLGYIERQTEGSREFFELAQGMPDRADELRVEEEKERQEKERQEEELREEWNDAFSEELDPKLEL